jgi:hypothetical protein
MGAYYFDFPFPIHVWNLSKNYKLCNVLHAKESHKARERGQRAINAGLIGVSGPLVNRSDVVFDFFVNGAPQCFQGMCAHRFGAIVLVGVCQVPNAGVSGSWTGINFAFNFGAESVAILTDDGNEPPKRYLCFESPS